MNWNRIKCAVFGHDWVNDAAKTVPGCVIVHDCAKCGKHESSIVWNNRLPWPSCTTPMPAVKPAKQESAHTMKISVECDGLAELEARTARLHAQWVEIAGMQRKALEYEQATGQQAR